ncbi:MAG: nucleoside-triphosphatase [Halanaerobiales bacterium]|nr:nucleoside-triphosphatase [Halanaerobiales bacterium]
MPNNIIITGDKYVGKSTLIKKCLDKFNLIPGGFVVGRTGQKDAWLSFYLVDPYEYYYRDDSKKSKIYKKIKKTFAKRNSPKEKFKVDPDVFDNKGVELLKTGLKYKDIVIMDELGRFELKALKFQKKVFEVLDSDKNVLAVLKDEHNVFLDKIRDREDITIIKLSDKNREDISNITYKSLKKLLTEEE